MLRKYQTLKGRTVSYSPFQISPAFEWFMNYEFFFFESGSYVVPCWPGTHYIAEGNLETLFHPSLGICHHLQFLWYWD